MKDMYFDYYILLVRNYLFNAILQLLSIKYNLLLSDCLHFSESVDYCIDAEHNWVMSFGSNLNNDISCILVQQIKSTRWM